MCFLFHYIISDVQILPETENETTRQYYKFKIVANLTMNMEKIKIIAYRQDSWEPLVLEKELHVKSKLQDYLMFLLLGNILRLILDMKIVYFVSYYAFFILVVGLPPKIEGLPSKIEVYKENMNSYFKFKVFGLPPPELTLSFNGEVNLYYNKS